MEKEELPNKKQAIRIIDNEMDFVRYQNVVRFDEKYKGEVPPEVLKIFD